MHLLPVKTVGQATSTLLQSDSWTSSFYIPTAGQAAPTIRQLVRPLPQLAKKQLDCLAGGPSYQINIVKKIHDDVKYLRCLNLKFLRRKIF